MKKSAMLFRMHTSNHICPFGLRSKDLLLRRGFTLDDHVLESREEVDNFKQQYEVETTPQAFINGQRIGGYEALRDYFDMSEPGQTGVTYTPVIAIFAMAFLMALGLSWSASPTIGVTRTVEVFIALSMAILAIQKIRDVYAFTNSFITYDLIAMRYIPYAYFYPFAEAFAGIGMLAELNGLLVGPVSLFIGLVGAISVIKAVYIDKRELTCACVGGNSNVPLGFISLTENIVMIGAGAWMIWSAL